MSPSQSSPQSAHKPEEKHPYGLDPEKTSTNERARPVIYFAGTRRLPITWLGPAYRQRTEEVTEQSPGGGKGGDEEEHVVGHDYFADVTGVVSIGVVDSIQEVWMDDERVWKGNVKRAGNYADITIEERGRMRIYWGTNTQAIDPLLVDHDHPAYRGQCYLVFEQLYFGRDRTQAPNVEVVVAREPRSSLGGARWFLQDVNPVHCIAEMLTNKRWGMGLDPALLDLAQMTTAAKRVVAEYLVASPKVEEQTSIRTLMLKLCEYIDGALTFRNGKLQLILNRVADGSGIIYPLIGEFDLVERPQWGSEGWSETTNQIAVNFTDRYKRYERDVEEVGSPAGEAIVGEPVKETLDRDWVCQRNAAHRIAVRYLRKSSVPLLTARLTVRRGLVDDELQRRADEVAAGGLIRFTSSAYQTTLLLRVVNVTVPSDRAQVVELECETDRYYNAVLDYQPDDVPGPDDDDVSPHRLLEARMIELPRELVEDDPGGENLTKPYFCPLVARRSVFDTRIKVLASEDGDTYRRFAIWKRFAALGTLTANLYTGRRIDPTGEIVLDVPSAMADRAWPVGTERQWWAGRYLAIIGREFIAFREVEILSATQVKLKGIIRARFGATWDSYPAGEPVFVIPKANLRGISRRWLTTDDDVWWKLIPGTKWSFWPGDEIDAESYVVRNLTLRPLGPCNLRVNSGRIGPFHRPGGGGVTIEWDSRAWQAHGLWSSFDAPYAAGGIEHRIYIYDDFGNELAWTKVNDAQRVQNYDGHFTYTIPYNGSGLSILGLFGGEPGGFSIRIFARVRGLNSTDFLGARIVLTGSGFGAADSGALCWPQSGLFHILRTTNPEPILQDNFTRIQAHLQVANPAFALPFPTITGSTARQARARTQANFNAIAANMGVTLHDVLGPGKPAPAWVVEANFELIDLHW